MKPTSLASAEFTGKKGQARRERFLADMETVAPWAQLEALIERHQPKSGRVGLPPVGLSKMLRLYFLQPWYPLTDEALEDALQDSQAMREFAGIDLSQQDVSNATTLSGHTGRQRRDEITQALRDGKLRRDIKSNIAMKPGTVRGMAEGH